MDALVLVGSTLNGNSVDDGDGGAIYNEHLLAITNTTFYSNTTSGQVHTDEGTYYTGLGGAIYNFYVATINNSTFISHTSAYTGTTLYNHDSGTLNLRNSLTAGQTTSIHCRGNPGENVNNLIEDGSCNPLLSSDPRVGALGDYGGDTQTIPLLQYSPAIDAGDAATCASSDQRGYTRPIDGTCDVGAVELAEEYAPLAGDDVYTTIEETTLWIGAASSLLSNDLDGDWDPLTATLILVNPAGGSVTLGADGSFAYTPTLDFNGTDSFTYVVSDGTLTDTARVTVTVSNVNDPPVADDDAFTVDEDSIANVLDVLAGDSDVDGDTLTVYAVGEPANGTAIDNDSDVLYTPDSGFTGTDVFTYTVTDSNDGFATATVTITVSNVNDPPVADDDAFTVDEDSAANVLDVLAGDSDPDDDPLTVYAVGEPANGTAVDNDSDVLYTPDPGFTGTDVFTYTVSDGRGDFDIGQVTVTVLQSTYEIFLPCVLRSSH